VRTPCTERWLGSASARVSQLEAGRGPRDRWIEIRGWGGIAQNRRTREAVAQVIRACICPPVESLVPRPATGELASQRRAPFLELKLSGFLARASLARGCGKPLPDDLRSRSSSYLIITPPLHATAILVLFHSPTARLAQKAASVVSATQQQAVIRSGASVATSAEKGSGCGSALLQKLPWDSRGSLSWPIEKTKRADHCSLCLLSLLSFFRFLFSLSLSLSDPSVPQQTHRISTPMRG